MRPISVVRTQAGNMELFASLRNNHSTGDDAGYGRLRWTNNSRDLSRSTSVFSVNKFITGPTVVETSERLTQLAFERFNPLDDVRSYESKITVLGVGPDNAIYATTYLEHSEPFERVTWERLSGSFLSAVAAATTAKDILHIFCVAKDRAIYSSRRVNGQWQIGWDVMGGSFSGTPSAMHRGKNSLDLVSRSTDGTIRHRRLIENTWSHWHNLGGSANSDPVLVTGSEERLDIFFIDINGTLNHGWFDGNLWSEWERVGDGLMFQPAAVSRGIGRFDVFATGIDKRLYRFTHSNGAWGTVEVLPVNDNRGFPDTVISSPSVVVTDQGNLDVFATGITHSQFPESVVGHLLHWHWDITTSRWFQNIEPILRVRCPSQYVVSVTEVNCHFPRSLGSDINTLSFSVTSGGSNIRTRQEFIGSQNGSIHNKHGPQIPIEPIFVGLSDKLVINMSILNSDENKETVFAKLESISIDFIKNRSKSKVLELGLLGVASLWAAPGAALLASGVKLIVERLATLTFAECDGFVAIDHIEIDGLSLYEATKNGQIYSYFQHYKGGTLPLLPSPQGCGSDSMYSIKIAISRSSNYS